LNNPEVVSLLKKHFVCFALNNAGWAQNVTPAEAIWLKNRGYGGCTAGMTVFTPGGQVLSPGGNWCYFPDKTLKVLQDIVSKHQQVEEKVKIEDTAVAVDPKELDRELPGARQYLRPHVPRPARDGLVLYVSWKALLPDDPAELTPGYKLADYKLYKNVLGVDRIWASKEEAVALIRGEFPQKLKQRLRPHIDIVMASKVKSGDLTRQDQQVSGSFLLENGERCDLLGFVEAREGKVGRFELLVKGMGTGANYEFSGQSSLGMIPPGKKGPVVLAFMLADANDELAKVQPSSRDLGGGEEK
jgi:hypothetical protein